MTIQAHEAPISLADLSAEQLADLMDLVKKQTITPEQRKKESREEYKKLAAEVTQQNLDDIEYGNTVLKELKTRIYNRTKSLLELKAEIFGSVEEHSGKKVLPQKTHSFTEKFGSFTLGFREKTAWNDTVTEGIKKIDAFLESLKHEDPIMNTLVDTVRDSLKRSRSGELRGSAVLELQNLKPKFNNALFDEGVDIISEAHRLQQTAWFIEGSVTGDDGKQIPLPLSISAVGFLEGFDTTWLKDLRGG